MSKTNTLFYLFPLLFVIAFTGACSKKNKIYTDIPEWYVPPPPLVINDTLPKLLFCDTSLVRTNLPSEMIKPGIESLEEYFPLLSGKNIAVVTNQTGVINNQHLVDFFIENNLKITKVFSPEHGFRGNIDRGKEFSDSIDGKTGLPIIALYGKNKKPTAVQLQDVDVVVFDIQDIGVRFFTYISTLHYVMEACAENGKHLVILDRPNPLGHYVDGPILKPEFKSFVGMHPIPVVHGLTVGELALMINGESWLEYGVKCKLTVIKAKNYTHSSKWSLSIKPSPNLPDDIAIRLYPSLCFFEATDVSIGRGTQMPFKIIGYPDKKFGDYSFIPHDITGMQTNPLHEGKNCYGINLQNETPDQTFTLKYFLEFADKFEKRADMITRVNWFNLLAGNNELYHDIINGLNESEIRKKWQKELDDYKRLRKKYLLYPDFE
jgi:uncharacterized protein YbbC (DUF1343 family)